MAPTTIEGHGADHFRVRMFFQFIDKLSIQFLYIDKSFLNRSFFVDVERYLRHMTVISHQSRQFEIFSVLFDDL